MEYKIKKNKSGKYRAYVRRRFIYRALGYSAYGVFIPTNYNSKDAAQKTALKYIDEQESKLGPWEDI